MLIRLSIRNAKRQFRDYSIFFLTLACTVSFLYAFHTLIFSDSMNALPDMEALPLMIVSATSLIVLIMGWIVGFATNDILKKRSRELAIYLLSGISLRSVRSLVFRENILIGAGAFAVGLPVGLLLSWLLEAIVTHMFAMEYSLRFSFSWKACGLTFLSFLLILLFAARRNGAWIKRASVRELLYLDRQNEQAPASGKSFCVFLSALSLSACLAGMFFLAAEPFGKEYDVLAGILCLVLFLTGFFQSVPAFLVFCLDRSAWKYRKNRLLLFREFTAKIHTVSTAMGILSVLLMLSLNFQGVGVCVYRIADQNAAQNVFDLTILHEGEAGDFSAYEAFLKSRLPVKSSHSWAIYTDGKTDFLDVKNRAVAASGHTGSLPYTEYQTDTCMRQSDYLALRSMLGYESVSLDPSLCYVHCLPALRNAFDELIRQNPERNCGGYAFCADGIFCEPFGQLEAYGNGLDYVLIVPDQAADRLNVVYSLWAALTEGTPDSLFLQEMAEYFPRLALLKRNVGASTPDGYLTSLVKENTDWLSGRWADNESLIQLYSISICLFYLALILEVTASAVLSVQLPGGRRKARTRILYQLGTPERLLKQLETRLLFQLFLFPAIPSLIISSCFIFWSGRKLEKSAFHLPVFSGEFWIWQAFGTALLFFLFLYAVYYVAVRIAVERKHGI